MFYLFLDESGDLGFDFSKAGTTKYFVVTVLLLPSTAAKRAMDKAVERTIRAKIGRNRAERSGLELKGAKTDLNVKEYFFRQCENVDFEIYTVILDKTNLPNHLISMKPRLYNVIARQAIDEVPWPKAETRIILSIDRSQPPHEIQILNQSLIAHLQGKIEPHVPLDIFHVSSQAFKCLQAVDMFSWGIFRKYEGNDAMWYDFYVNKIRNEIRFVAPK